MEKKKNDIIKILTMKPFWSDNDKLCTIRAVISYVFAAASFVLMFAILWILEVPMFAISVFVIAIFLALQKEYYNRKAHILSYVDELTGAYNRRYFLETVDRDKIKIRKITKITRIGG